MKPLELLIDSLNKELPTRKGHEHEVRDLMAFAESYGATIATQLKALSAKLAEDENKAYGEVRKKEEKLTADEKKAIVAAKVAETEADLEYYKTLERLIKQRCSVGQSFLKTMGQEAEPEQPTSLADRI